MAWYFNFSMFSRRWCTSFWLACIDFWNRFVNEIVVDKSTLQEFVFMRFWMSLCRISVSGLTLNFVDKFTLQEFCSHEVSLNSFPISCGS